MVSIDLTASALPQQLPINTPTERKLMADVFWLTLNGAALLKVGYPDDWEGDWVELAKERPTKTLGIPAEMAPEVLSGTHIKLFVT